MNKHNISLNGLRVFEAAARHLSFTTSAVELNVSQAAVSQQIRSLEDQVGIKLFIRSTRSLSLSPAGEELLKATQSALKTINNALDNITHAGSSKVLTISTLPSFASRWLIPRIDDFQQNNTDIELHIHTSNSKIEFSDSKVDAAIRLRAYSEPNLVTELLISEALCLICTPELAKKIGKKRENLYKYPLSIDSRQLASFGPKDMTQQETEKALDELGLDKTQLKIRNFSSSDNVILSALEGQSTALTRLSLCVDDLDANRFVVLFNYCKALEHGTSLVYPQTQENNIKLRTFRDWLHLEAQQYNTRLERYVSH